MPRVIETNLTEEDKKIEKTLRPQCLESEVDLKNLYRSGKATP